MKITLDEQRNVVCVYLENQETGKWLPVMRQLSNRRWAGERGRWEVPYVKELYTELAAKGLPVGHIAPPTASAYRIERPFGQNVFIIRTLKTPDDMFRCKRIPEYRSWSGQHDAWVCQATPVNKQYLQNAFPYATWSTGVDHAQQVDREVVPVHKARELARSPGRVVTASPEVTDEVTDHKFRRPQYRHQRIAFNLARKARRFALFMEQGTGKTAVAINTTAYWFMQGEVDAMVVLCPNGVKSNWADELEQDLPADIRADVFIWEPATRGKVNDFLYRGHVGAVLRVLIMNSEALATPAGTKAYDYMISRYRAAVIVDESTRFKSPVAARTRTLLRSASKVKHKLLLSGTPITQGPLDVFAPMKFLGEDILGFSSIYRMREAHCLMGGFNGKQIVGYVNLQQISDKLAPYSYRVLKAECLDLPPKIYQRRYVTLSEVQRQLYDSMRDEMLAELRGEKVEVQHAIVKLTRLQQIIGGFLPVPVDEGGKLVYKVRQIEEQTPKVQELLDLTQDLDGKAIIWARFRGELRLIAAALRQEYGEDSVVEFHGGVLEQDRTTARRRFQDPKDPARWFVGQPAAGGIGLTLTQARTAVYFSNDFNLETRLQSEDRAHRIGQNWPVNIIDLVARGTLDPKLLRTLLNKKGLADLITGDPSFAWLDDA